MIPKKSHAVGPQSIVRNSNLDDDPRQRLCAKMQVMTVVEGKVSRSKLEEFQSAYAEVGKDPKPPGWVRSMLLHDTAEPGLFRISTLWENREALDKMRVSTKVPVAVGLFRNVGIEPAVRIFAVPLTIER